MTELDQPLPPIERLDGDGDSFDDWRLVEARCERGDLIPTQVNATIADLLSCLSALPVETRDEVIKHALGIGGLGGFETDPRDSAALLELRQVIDDELGWESEEQEEEADYVARVREVAALMRGFRKLLQVDADEPDALKAGAKTIKTLSETVASAAHRSGFISAVGALHNAMPQGFVETDSDKVIGRVADLVRALAAENEAAWESAIKGSGVARSKAASLAGTIDYMTRMDVGTRATVLELESALATATAKNEALAAEVARVTALNNSLVLERAETRLTDADRRYLEREHDGPEEENASDAEEPDEQA